jgi:hypothetical protein
MVTICPSCFNSQSSFCIYGFRMILTVNCDYLLEQREPVDLCDGEVLCFLCGTDWILKYYLDELRLQRVIWHRLVLLLLYVTRLEYADSIIGQKTDWRLRLVVFSATLGKSRGHNMGFLLNPSKLNRIILVAWWDFRLSRRRARKWLSSRMLSRVVWYKFTDVSEMLTASIIRAMSKPRAWNWFEIRFDRISQSSSSRVAYSSPWW